MRAWGSISPALLLAVFGGIGLGGCGRYRFAEADSGLAVDGALSCVGDGSSCSNHGTCDDSSGAIVCSCNVGYDAPLCDTCSLGFVANGALCDPTLVGTCTDGVLNQDELMVDCGGACDPCVLSAVMVDTVRGGSLADTPQADRFRVRTGPAGNPYYWGWSFLKFDLGGIASTATISQATLSLLDVVASQGGGALSWRIAEIVDGNGWSNNNWDQSVTYNTRPAFGEHHTPEGQEEYVVDVTAGPIALRPDLIDPGGLYGLYFEVLSPSNNNFDGSSDTSAYLLELD